jgi:hypothetical protein
MESRELFSIDENGLLIINRIEARQIKEFKEILSNDKGSEGDYDGRRKYHAFKEFMYVYHMASPKSIYRDLPDKKRKTRALLETGLGKDWKETQLIKDAIQSYKEVFKLTGSEHAYYNASKGLYSIGEDLALFNEANARTRDKIRKLKLEIEDDNITPDQLESKEYMLDKLTENLSKNTQEIIKLSGILPGAYKALEDLYEKMRKEQEGQKKIYGGGDLGNREL